MRVRLSIDESSTDNSSTAEELRSLYAWLLDDSRARRCAEVEWEETAPAPAEGMGGLLDVLSLVLGSGFSAASLALSLAQWRDMRGRPGPGVAVERPDGTRVVVNTGSVEDAERLLASLLSTPRRDPTTPSPPPH